MKDTWETSCTFTQYINGPNVEDINKIIWNMQLKLKNSLPALHSHIHILWPKHWFNKSDDNLGNKTICD